MGKANLLNKHFQSVFSAETDDQIPTVPQQTEAQFSLNNITLNKNGIVKLIQNLNPHKAPGPDGLSPKLLKLAPEIISEYLLHLFRKCFELKTIPSAWKLANVTPVFKKGNRTDPSNYRPISLTSVLCKLFEHIITSNLATHLENNQLFSEDQFGFRKTDHVNCSFTESSKTCHLHWTKVKKLI